jgi:hypothetical protein
VRLSLVLLLSSIAFGQSGNDDHDKYGFPITFDSEVITLTDLVRAQGLDDITQIGRVGQARDTLLMEKLTERVGELYGLTVENRDIEDWIKKQILTFDSEAEFYEDLMQQGLTLETFREETKRKVLAQRLDSLVQRGFLPQGQRLLPWDPQPTPKEIRIAFVNDSSRGAAGTRVIWHELRVEISQKKRQSIYSARIINPDLSDADLELKVTEALAPILKSAREGLAAGKTLEQVAKTLNLNVTRKGLEIANEPSESPLLRFLQKAESGAQSELIDIGKGRFLVARVEQLDRSTSVTLNDPRVVESYRQRIAELKQKKANFTLRVRALDKSIVRPERVRKQLRKLLMTELGAAHAELRKLGLH